jgi:hypothetical protein
MLKKAEYAPAMAGCSIAIHTLYGISVACYQPYADDQASVHDNGFDDLDRLAVFHSGVQVLLVIIGLCATEENGDAIAVVVLIVMVIAAIVTAREILRIQNRAEMKGAQSLDALRSDASAYQASYCEVDQPEAGDPLTAAEAASIIKEEGTDEAVTKFSVGSRRFELKEAEDGEVEMGETHFMETMA